MGDMLCAGGVYGLQCAQSCYEFGPTGLVARGTEYGVPIYVHVRDVDET